jgi:Apea-like HEPN
MAKVLFESKYVIRELYHLPQLPIPEFRISDDILLKQIDEETCIFILHDKGSIYIGEREDNSAEKALTYFGLLSLVSVFLPKVEGVSTIRIRDPKSLGNNVHKQSVQGSLTIPQNRKDAAQKAKEEYKLFLDSTKRLIDKYGRLNNRLPFLRISSEYCYRARINQDVVGGSFVDAMVCLEALLNEEPNNIKFKLSMRGAFILGLNGFDTSNAFSRLKELYNLRSSIVHGSKKRPKVEDTLELIVYARRCLISFYILCFNCIGTNTPTKDLKQELLQEIDQAMIDSSSESLQKEINNAIPDFEISGIPFMIDDRDWKVKNKK